MYIAICFTTLFLIWTAATLANSDIGYYLPALGGGRNLNNATCQPNGLGEPLNVRYPTTRTLEKTETELQYL